MAMQTKNLRLDAAHTAPAEDVAAVTPSDTVDLPDGVCRALYIGVSGDITLATQNSPAGVLFKAVPVGVLPVRTRRVYATGTTATNIVALN